jgi:hypothetical protein
MPKIIAGMAEIKHVKGLRIASISDAMASPLVLAAIIGGCVAEAGKTPLQELHICAPSGFCVPHFGQYIIRSPLDLLFIHNNSPRYIFSPLYFIFGDFPEYFQIVAEKVIPLRFEPGPGIRR